jgi:hypothetical protein
MTGPEPICPPAGGCRNCPASRVLARGWCSACYFRWYRAGKPETGPPPTPQERREEYAFLRSQGLTRAEATVRLSIDMRTSRDYELLLQEGALAA